MSIVRGIIKSIVKEFGSKREEEVHLEKCISTGISIVSFPVASKIDASVHNDFAEVMNEIYIYHPRLALINADKEGKKEFCIIIDGCNAPKVKQSLTRYGFKNSKIESAETFQNRVKPYCDINRTEYRRTSFNEL